MNIHFDTHTQVPAFTTDLAVSGQTASSQDARGASLLAGEGVTFAASGLADVDGVTAEIEAALTRDDDLGRLMDRAFNLPAPPMPAFGD